MKPGTTEKEESFYEDGSKSYEFTRLYVSERVYLIHGIFTSYYPNCAGKILQHFQYRKGVQNGVRVVFTYKKYVGSKN